MAKKKTDNGVFAGREQKHVLALVLDSALEATQLAVADNGRRGIDSYEGKTGQIVVRKAGQTRPTH